MSLDRRKVFRIRPNDLTAELQGITVRICDLSLGGVKVYQPEDQKLPLKGEIIFHIEYEKLPSVELKCLLLEERDKYARLKFIGVSMVQEMRLARIITSWQLKRALVLYEKRNQD